MDFVFLKQQDLLTHIHAHGADVRLNAQFLAFLQHQGDFVAIVFKRDEPPLDSGGWVESPVFQQFKQILHYPVIITTDTVDAIGLRGGCIARDFQLAETRGYECCGIWQDVEVSTDGYVDATLARHTN